MIFHQDKLNQTNSNFLFARVATLSARQTRKKDDNYLYAVTEWLENYKTSIKLFHALQGRIIDNVELFCESFVTRVSASYQATDSNSGVVVDSCQLCMRKHGELLRVWILKQVMSFHFPCGHWRSYVTPQDCALGTVKSVNMLLMFILNDANQSAPSC